MVDFWTPSPYRLFDLSGEVAVVTGATGILGGVMARKQLEAARDALLDRWGRVDVRSS